MNKVFTKLRFLVYHRKIILPNEDLPIFLSTFSPLFTENISISILITTVLAYFNAVRNFPHSLSKHNNFPMKNDLEVRFLVQVWAASRGRRSILCHRQTFRTIDSKQCHVEISKINSYLSQVLWSFINFSSLLAVSRVSISHFWIYFMISNLTLKFTPKHKIKSKPNKTYANQRSIWKSIQKNHHCKIVFEFFNSCLIW